MDSPYTPSIMEGVFFATHPVWWISPIHLISYIVAILGGMLIGIFLWWNHKNTNIQSKAYERQLIDPEDQLYLEKTLAEIRRYLAYHYFPEHSWAHIPDNMMQYVDTTRLLEIIRFLEKREYSGMVLETHEKTSINTELAALLV